MRAHLVGGGLASLAAAAYLIRDGGLPGGNITIYETAPRLGGCLAAFGDPASGYVMPGARIFEREYRCALEFLSLIPSASDPGRSVKAEIEDFKERFGWYDRTRLVDGNGRVVDPSSFGLSLRDKLDLSRLLLTPQSFLDGLKIDSWFAPSFFDSSFWMMWATTMTTLRHHSLAEMRRYMLRFLYVLPDFANLSAIYRTRFDQYEAILEPAVAWLARQDVVFRTATTVTDVDFLEDRDRLTARCMMVESGGVTGFVDVAENDLVLVTAGSPIDGLSVGSHAAPPAPPEAGKSWALWARLAESHRGFGNPRAFFGKPRESTWVTFTVTARDPLFLDLLKEFSGSDTGRGGLITFTGSNWLLTIVAFHQPEFVNQPPDVQLWWGFGLHGSQPGNFVAKPMTACSGREILEEVVGHLRFDRDRDRILAASNCIPCHMPEVGSVFAAHREGDRPAVVPRGCSNFGFIGQYAELADECTLTMEYAVRSAREAVRQLLKLDRGPPPPYNGLHHPEDLYRVTKALAAVQR